MEAAADEGAADETAAFEVAVLKGAGREVPVADLEAEDVLAFEDHVGQRPAGGEYGGEGRGGGGHGVGPSWNGGERGRSPFSIELVSLAPPFDGEGDGR